MRAESDLGAIHTRFEFEEYRASNERGKIKKYEGKKLTGRRVELWYLREGYLVKATRL